MKACLASGGVISSVMLSISLKETAWCYIIRPSPYASLRRRHICGFPPPGATSGGDFELSNQPKPEDNRAASVLDELSGKQRQYLRSIANKRAAAKDGSLVSIRMGSLDRLEAFTKELSAQFKKHELLKVKMPKEVRAGYKSGRFCSCWMFARKV